MNNSHRLTLGLAFMLLLSSCHKPNPLSSDVSSSSDKSSSLVNEGSSTTSESTLSESETTSISEAENVKTAVVSFLSNSLSYGNTNGNANNYGLAVYDHTKALHYFAFRDQVYSFDPATSVKNLLFSTSDGSFVRHLSLAGKNLYYESSSTHYTYKYDLESYINTEIYNAETLSLYRYEDHVFIQSNKDYYGTMTIGLADYNNKTQALTTKFLPGTNNINLSWGRIIYNAGTTPTVQLADQSYAGKTNLKYFEELGFTGLLTVNVIAEKNNRYQFALLLVNSGETALYYYDANSDNLVKIHASADINSINSDGKHIYFLDNGILYVYDIETASLNQKFNAGTVVKYINVINNWLYLGQNDFATLTRLNPETGSLEMAVI